MQQYWFSRLPNAGHAKKYKVKNKDKKEIIFSFPYSVIETWGNPVDGLLKSLMISFIQVKGWSKGAVEFGKKETPRNLHQYISALNKEKGPEKRKSK